MRQQPLSPESLVLSLRKAGRKPYEGQKDLFSTGLAMQDTGRDSRVPGKRARSESEERQKRDEWIRTASAPRVFRRGAPDRVRPADRFSGTAHPDALGSRNGASGG